MGGKETARQHGYSFPRRTQIDARGRKAMCVAGMQDDYWDEFVDGGALFNVQSRLLLKTPTERRPQLQEPRTDWGTAARISEFSRLCEAGIVEVEGVGNIAESQHVRTGAA